MMLRNRAALQPGPLRCGGTLPTNYGARRRRGTQTATPMTITYDPAHHLYLDEADVRNELSRGFDLCLSCRKCEQLCQSFPTLFRLADRLTTGDGVADAGRLTPAQQDDVVDGCWQCMMCAQECPYTPERHEHALDFPRLMLRAKAMRHIANPVPVRVRVTNAILGHTDRLGAVATSAAPLANRLVSAPQGSLVRRVVEKVTGVSSIRLLSPFVKQRFSTWFDKRPKLSIGNRQGHVAVFPTCVVEYQQPAIGEALVKVYERNGIECSLADGARCCGAPWLHAGDVGKFVDVATKNVAALAAVVRAGKDIVVPQPTCTYVLKQDYLDYVGGPSARLVADHTFDAAEYLMNLHLGDTTQLDTDFTGTVPATVTYHLPCHLKAQGIGFKSRDLIRLTGARIKLVQRCSGVDGMWGLRRDNADVSLTAARALADDVRRAGGQVVSGDCHLANTAICEQTGDLPLHPMQLVAQAYGFEEDPR
jgi:glycerol-3-phosphate dehydrogenase subunit C